MAIYLSPTEVRECGEIAGDESTEPFGGESNNEAMLLDPWHALINSYKTII